MKKLIRFSIIFFLSLVVLLIAMNNIYPKCEMESLFVQQDETSEIFSNKIGKDNVFKEGALSEAPDERREFEILKRGGEIIPKKVEAARKKMRKLMKDAKAKADSRDAGLLGWQDLGPKNVGGRIRAIVINPNNSNEIFIGAAAGGIWRSPDGGSNWALQNESYQAYPVTSLAYDPFNNNILYATTGEYRGGGPEFPGVGVLKSVDGGINWDVLPSPAGANFLWLSKVEMNPLLQNSLFVAGTTGDENANNNQDGLAVIYRSNDGGQSWDQDWATITSNFIFDMELNPNDTSEMIIGTNNGVRMRNGNSGFINQMGSAPKITTLNNWVGRRCEVEYCAQNPNTIYVSRYTWLDADNDGRWENVGTELWQTTNGGSNWNSLNTTTGTNENVNPLTSQGDYSHALWVDPTNCNRAMLGGINLWRWQNNILGRISHWPNDINGNSNGSNNSLHADFHTFATDPGYNGSTNRKVLIGNDGGIYGSNDVATVSIGLGWFALNSELNITQLYGADISKSGDTIIAGSQDNSYFVDINADNGLQTYFTFTTGDGGFSAINKSNPNTMFSTIQRGILMRSVNGGSTFCQIVSLDGSGQFGCCNGCANFFNNGGVSDTSLFIAPMKMDPVNNSTIFMGARRLWRGTNNGNNWAGISPVFTRSISAIDVDLTNNSIIWFGLQNGSVYKTENGGTNWVKVDTNGTVDLRNGFLTDLAISPLDSDKVIATVGGYNSEHIYFTDDGGDNWVQRSLGFDVHVESVTWHPTIDNWVYVGTDVGIFASQDDGISWSVDPVFDNNEGPVNTRIAELFWQGDGSAQFPYYLCAATHGRGLWRSITPVTRDLFVDKDCTFLCGLGTEAIPYKTFREALDKAGPGSRIVFLTAGTYEEGTPAMLVNENIEIVKADGVPGSLIIK